MAHAGMIVIRPRWFKWLLWGVAALTLLGWGATLAQAQTAIAVPPGAPSWASTAVNLEYRPIDGVSKIAYVSLANGDDGTGSVWTYDESHGDIRIIPGGVTPFATGDAAIAAIGTREGSHAVLFESVDADGVHINPVVNGGCQGTSSAHPWMFGSYWANGEPNTDPSKNVAVFDTQATGNPTETHMFSVQRSGGFSNLIIQDIYFRLSHRIAFMDDGSANPDYDETDALNTDYNIGGLRIYGNSSNVLVRNCRINGLTEGCSVEGIANANGSRLQNVVFDHCILQDTWQASGTYENLFVSYNDRFRFLNGVNLGSGWNRFDDTIGPGDTAQGRCQGTYLSFCKEPWIHNTIVALASNEGIQARCGGFVTACFLYANAGGVAWGHGQNEYATRKFTYEAQGADMLVWGVKPVGGTNENGRGIGWGLCNSLKLDRYVIVGQDAYRAGDNNYGLNIGVTTNGTTVKIGPGCTYDWNTSGVSASAALSLQSGGSTGATMTITGFRPYEKRGYLFYSEGTEATTRNRWNSATLVAGRYDKNGTAATYGPSGTAPTRITAGGVEGYAKRPLWSGGSAPTLQTVLGFSSEAAMIRAWLTPYSRWDATRVINKVNPEFGFGQVRSYDPAAPNVP